MTLVDFLVSRQPNLKKKLRIARINKTPNQYVKMALNNAIMFSIAIALVTFFLASKNEPNFILPSILLIISLLFFYSLNIRKVDIYISKKAKEIDKSVLFAGRFLLIKLSSGSPLMNSVEEASKSYGEASEYFKEIIREMELGTTMESAFEKTTEYCPSKNLKKVLFQITNSLKIGIDVTQFLEAILDEIADEQLTEIMKYGKKLSSLTMFYMLLAIILPSLGMTLFVVIASLISINVDMLIFLVIILGLAFVQFIFISLFRGARPNMEV
jgi:pilus assembly protein TadC